MTRWLRRHYSLGRFLAVSFAVAALAVALLLMCANTVGEGIGDDMTPATAPGGSAVPYEEEP